MHKLKLYYQLIKPGVTYGNAISAVAGFLLASGWWPDWSRFIGLTVGETLVIAAACVLNNHLDRDIDRKMSRTRTRPTAAGQVSSREAVTESILLGVSGTVVLALTTNWLATSVTIAGFLIYVWPYGAWTKRRSVHGTLVGAISGALPILAGYLAARGYFDIGALLVFLVIFFWQMPEFYSISIYRKNEYKKAGVPVISVVRGTKRTKLEIFLYTLAFVVSTLSLTLAGYTGWIYFVIMLALGGYWLLLGARGLKPSSGDDWARTMFRFSLVILLAFSFLISIDGLLV
ncbi:MAG TPA: heme o synthase [Candidatus Saccharimonadales bacterium]|nr:heme o synthase [Candidatus Saccharimonadales bacterium]